MTSWMVTVKGVCKDFECVVFEAVSWLTNVSVRMYVAPYDDEEYAHWQAHKVAAAVPSAGLMPKKLFVVPVGLVHDRSWLHSGQGQWSV